eukprot:3838378-Prymnesium_polylepis.1
MGNDLSYRTNSQSDRLHSERMEEDWDPSSPAPVLTGRTFSPASPESERLPDSAQRQLPELQLPLQPPQPQPSQPQQPLAQPPPQQQPQVQQPPEDGEGVEFAKVDDAPKTGSVVVPKSERGSDVDATPYRSLYA